MVRGRIHARWTVRLSIARRGGWRSWLAVSADFERGLEALVSKTVIMPHIDAETRRGRDYVRVTLAMTIVACDVAEALDGAWRAFQQASRSRARVGSTGEPILLFDQNRAHWDQLLIRRGLAALQRAEQLGGGLGPYGIQAAIAACHAQAVTAEDTEWTRIVALYDALAQLTPSPIVELNRAVAVAMAFGPQAGLELVDTLHDEQALKNYHLLPSVRGNLLSKLGRFGEARAEYEMAAALTRNARERNLLLERARACNALPKSG